MKLEPNKKYKVVDDDLINGSCVLTGKQLNKLIEKAYKDVMESKKMTPNNKNNDVKQQRRAVIEDIWFSLITKM